MSPCPTDFHRATTKNFHPTITVHQLEPTPQSPLLEIAPSFFPLRLRCSSLNSIRASTELFIIISQGSFLFTLPKFYIIFILSPTPFPLCFFCLVFFHLISEFELDLNHISSPRSQVRALHFCSFTIRLASISVRSRVNKNKPKEDHQLLFPIWCHFYFVSHSIPTSFLFGFPFHFDYRHTLGVLEIFTKPSPSNDVSLHFTLEPCPSVATHIFHGKPQDYCKVSLYPTLRGNDPGPPVWKFGLLSIARSS